MIKWTKKRPKRSGLYLTKDKRGNIELMNLDYCSDSQSWIIFDYPNADFTEDVEDAGIKFWSDRIQ